jgi:CheY-like chemotaxis protein
MMPAGDGFSVLDKLALSSDTVVLPVIVLTASPRFDIEDKLKARGVSFFLRKPYDPDELLKCLRTCLGEDSDHEAHESK